MRRLGIVSAVALLALTATQNFAQDPGSAGGEFGGRGGHRNLRALGGGAKTEQVVDGGLLWLARAERPDGSWPGNPAAGFSDEAATGLALLAFLGAGETHQHGSFKETVGKGLRHLHLRQAPDGWVLAEGVANRVHDQGIVATALAEAFALTASPLYSGPAERAVLALWTARGGESWRDADALVWTALALKSARAAGLAVPDGLAEVVKAFDALPEPRSVRVTAMATFARLLAGADPRRDPDVLAGAATLLQNLPVWDEATPGAIDFRTWHFGTLACFLVGDETWKRWNQAIKTVVIDHRIREGELAGTWEPVGPWVKEAGRVAGTALLTMCMETYYRYAKVFGSSQGGPNPAAAVLPPSTGGTREPNGNPYGLTFFEHYGVNPFEDTEDDRLSTFALDVDAASFSIARRFLADGNLPDPSSVRTEEFVNAFPGDDAPPREGTFALSAEGMPSPFGGPRYQLVRLGIRAREVEPADRKPARLTFVVDISGSMNIENRLGLVKRALRLLVSRLKRDDQVALVVYGSTGRLLLGHSSDRKRLLATIDRLATDGATNVDEGLAIGYREAAKAFLPGGINRIVLCSDGVGNTGETRAKAILAGVAEHAAKGIEISTVGFGMGNYNDVLMEKLADKGNGNYAYVDTIHEARRIFGRELTGMLQTVAKDAKVQVEWNPDVVARYRLLGYENRAIRDEEFRDDAVDGGEVGAGHTVTALYELKLNRDAPDGPLGTFRIRYALPDSGGRVVEESMPLRRAVLSGKPSRHLLLTAAVAEFAELLRHSYWARDGSYAAVSKLLDEVLPLYPENREVEELAAMAKQAGTLAEPGEGAPPPEERPDLPK